MVDSIAAGSAACGWMDPPMGADGAVAAAGVSDSSDKSFNGRAGRVAVSMLRRFGVELLPSHKPLVTRGLQPQQQYDKSFSKRNKT